MRLINLRYISNWRVLLIAVVVLICLLLSSQLGEVKPYEIVDPLDILGEGSTLFLTILIVIFTVTDRPRGNVTNLFIAVACSLFSP
jgi:hypothetical protein